MSQIRSIPKRILQTNGDTPEGRAKRLEENFKVWLIQAKSDFETLASSRDPDFISEMAAQKLHSYPSDLREKIGIVAPTVLTPRAHRIVRDARKAVEAITVVSL